MERLLGSRSFTIEDQQRFGAFSGDMNPLHVDPVPARREIYGGVIAHGACAVLSALEAFAAELNSRGVAAFTLVELAVKYPSPIYLDRRVDIVLGEEGEGWASIEVRDPEFETVGAEIKVKWRPVEAPSHAARDRSGHDRDVPRFLDFEAIRGLCGSMPLYMDRKALDREFPRLARMASDAPLAGVLSISRLAGMECPGLRSVCLSFDVTFPDAGATGTPADLEYRATMADPRFSLVRLALSSPFMTGTLTTLYRPAPALQEGADRVRAAVEPGEFSGEVAFIVGGSRGLGEVAAKIVTAGGGDAVITYHSGLDDAERVAGELRSLGGSGRIFPCDVQTPEACVEALVRAGIRPTHLSCFATPRMAMAKKTPFSEVLFQRFASFYVSGFHRLVRACRVAWPQPLRVFYPSSAHVGAGSAGLEEYIVAKAAGEALCTCLARSDEGLRIHVERLPASATDQSLSIPPRPSEPPLQVMLGALRRMRKGAG